MKTIFSLEQISAGELAAMCGGEVRPSYLAGIRLTGICTDSAEADADTVFSAIRGERADGHDYIVQALSKGCRCVLCERSCEAIEVMGACAIVVNDTELALAKLANAYKNHLTAKTVAVTGSVGKTTTKDMIAEVLSMRFRAFRTKGNYNSVIGMPLSMTEIPLKSEYAVLEMGMSGFGEIERLSVTAEPDYAVITNIGTSHLEMLGSRENICRAKLEILCGLKNGGTLFLPYDEPLLAGIHGKSYRTVYVSLECEKADFYAKNIRVEPDCTVFDIVWAGGCEKDLSVSVLGRHNVYAALYAFAVGIEAGLTPDEIREGLSHYQTEGMRQHVFRLGEITIIEDCYNASPESMIAAIDVLDNYCKRTGARSIAVLGDMLELGEESPSLHRLVGAHLAKRGVDLLLAVGNGVGQLCVGARQVGMSARQILQFSGEEIPEVVGTALLNELMPGDAVLLKGSRGMRMERLLSWLENHMEE